MRARCGASRKSRRCRPTVVTQRPSLGGDLVPTGDFSHPVQLDQRTDQGSEADVESIASAGLETDPVTRGHGVEEWVVGAVHALEPGEGIVLDDLVHSLHQWR